MRPGVYISLCAIERINRSTMTVNTCLFYSSGAMRNIERDRRRDKSMHVCVTTFYATLRASEKKYKITKKKNEKKNRVKRQTRDTDAIVYFCISDAVQDVCLDSRTINLVIVTLIDYPMN